MPNSTYYRLLPTFPLIAEAFPEGSAVFQEPQKTYQSIRSFRPGETLSDTFLYLLKKEDAALFPVDRLSYLSTQEIPGQANHICCPGLEETEILDRAVRLFSELREQEMALDQLLYQGVSLDTLCESGAAMLENPVYIHDDWFIALAMSAQVHSIMPPEYVMTSTAGFVPQVILDDFKYDNEYLETYAHHTPQIWTNTSAGPRSLYVNLWDGNVYRGRLLVFETNRPFREKDFLLARLLAQHALLLLRRKTPGGNQSRSMDDLVYQLLQGAQPDPADLGQMLRTLNWNTDDQFTVIRVQAQQTASTVMDRLLHSDLFRSFPHCYILLSSYQQCVVLNLTRQNATLPAIRHILAPLCRDYCLYAGISSPAASLSELHFSYIQAGIALNKAFQLRNEKWIIPFSDCALDHWIDHLSGELQTRHLLSPELSFLIRYDRENGTEYYPTLREYLLQERNIPQTSQKLIIHRTTLLYRLKKIQSLVPLNLDDPRVRLYLLLSLHMLENT